MISQLQNFARLADSYAYARHREEDSYGRPANMAQWQKCRDQAFAELIILQCARISADVDETFTGQGEASAQAFKEYFGIKP